MSKLPLIFIVNPGSASRKYAIYHHEKCLATVNFELVEGKVAAKIYAEGKEYFANYDDGNLNNASHRVVPLLLNHEIISSEDKIVAIGLRIVAPSNDFTKDILITDHVIKQLESIAKRAPLHLGTALLEIKQLRLHYPKLPIVAISDSEFHNSKPDYSKYYAVDTDLSDKLGLYRYGYHGISVGSIVRNLKKRDILIERTVICHLGSGSSISAVFNGKSVDNTMGYSPLEGVMMATRSGSMDILAALEIKKHLNFTDSELQEYLFRQSGLKGVSGSSDDIRQLLASEKSGDKKAKLALDIYVHRLALGVAQMAGSLGGVGCLVFSGTVGERSAEIRKRLIARLSYLGFVINSQINDEVYEPKEIVNIASDNSKPIIVISTDEAAELARRTAKYILSK